MSVASDSVSMSLIAADSSLSIAERAKKVAPAVRELIQKLETSKTLGVQEFLAQLGEISALNHGIHNRGADSARATAHTPRQNYYIARIVCMRERECRENSLYTRMMLM